MMVLYPVEVIGYTLGGADKVRVDLDYGTELGSLNSSIESSNYGIPYDYLLGDLVMNPSYGSFDVPNDVPPEGAFLGYPIEDSVCGADSWNLFEALIHFLKKHFWILQMAPFMVSMMAHQEVNCLELHLRRLAVGTTRGAFLRPA